MTSHRPCYVTFDIEKDRAYGGAFKAILLQLCHPEKYCARVDGRDELFALLLFGDLQMSLNDGYRYDI